VNNWVGDVVNAGVNNTMAFGATIVSQKWIVTLASFQDVKPIIPSGPMPKQLYVMP